ncbi:MAG: SulP family inorganic anion transporter, partial [Gammaproteobacteria bacterium]|nr:SulP family inorganic anion transporter [Gammaproteobacteria bacterium]
VIVSAVFGSSRQLATGPVAVISLLTASALEPIASSGSEGYIAYAIMLALMVGVFQIALGLLRLGVLVDFLSHPVVLGFTNAAALIIATSQLGKLLGVVAEKSEHHYETVWNILVAASEFTHWPTVAMSVVAIGLMYFLPRFWQKIPAILVAAVLTTVASWAMDFKENFGGAIVGAIPEGLPSFVLPTVDFSYLLDLAGVAIAISLIGFMEAFSVAKSMSMRKTRQHLDANQELLGQGLGNLAASMFQGYAVSGSFSRSAVNLSAGAVTGFSSVVTGLLVAATLLFLTPILYHMPQAMLASVIIIAVAGLIRVKPIIDAWKVQKHDAVVAVITFVLTLAFAPHLENGIIIGVLLALGLFVYRIMRPNISLISRDSMGKFADARRRILETCCSISMLRFDGPLFFANTGYFSDQVLRAAALTEGLRYIIVDASSITEIDSTGEHMLHSLARELVDSEITFIVTRAKPEIMEIFERTGFASPEWSEYFTATREEAMDYAMKQMRICGDKPCGCTRDKCPMMTKPKPGVI